MKLFFAGGVTGNLREFWKTLANSNHVSQEKVIECMRLYTAGIESRKDYIFENLLSKTEDGINFKHINILESYYYLRKNAEFMRLVTYFGSFLLDSGAFTFMQGNHSGKIDWDGYVEEYASFINKFNVELFFELDIATEYYIQPCDTGNADINQRIINEAIEFIKQNPKWKLSLQTQKILNIR